MQVLHDGGFIVVPEHNIQMDTPVENILAMYNAAKQCIGEISESCMGMR